MYIDFHTHAFADNIAERAVTKLEAILRESGCSDKVNPPATDGTAGDLLGKTDAWGVDAAVILPIATKPSQQRTINDWAADIMSDRLFCFGTVHPEAEDALCELERIKALGLKGVKLHPDQQDFFADEERVFPIYRKCAELGLPVTLHAGYDASSMDCVHCTPAMGAEIIDKVPGLTLIIAHLGGYKMWDDTEKYLVGRNVYLDTAYTVGNIDPVQAERIIKNHGADKILLASDCPWHSTREEISFLDGMELSAEEKDRIFYKNAADILGINFI